MASFQDNSGKAVKPLWILLQQKMMQVVMATNGTLRQMCKFITCIYLQLNHYHRYINTSFYRPDSLPATQPQASKCIIKTIELDGD